MSKLDTVVLPVLLESGTRVFVEASVLNGEEEVALSDLDFSGVSDAVEGIAAAVIGAIAKVKPHKATVELGLEVAVESGKLTALIVKGAGKANFKIGFEWSAPNVQRPST